MAIVRLTAAAWLDYEVGRVKGVLKCHLTRNGLEASELIALIEMWGLHYTPAELVLLRNRLIADGVIEIV